MCGIAGIWAASESETRLREQLSDMKQVLRPRGPDGEGSWIDGAASVALGHQRLSIRDLSDEGRQPMVSESGRFVLTYNGELYNVAELMEQLGREATSFRGHSDTEVALAVIEKLGLQDALGLFNGMFALALWDREKRCLQLARDRVGIKPLFYGIADSSLLFSSQTSSFLQYPGFDKSFSDDALSSYMRSGCIAAPHSIYKDAQQLMPGTIVSFASPDADAISHRYWDPRAIALQGHRNPREISAARAKVELRELLQDSVKRRLVSDVPVGAFLSGGIDSTAVVALASQVSASPVQTFTIGFAEASHDESAIAKQIASHLGTQHTEMIVSPRDAQGAIERIGAVYDEPFADSSQIPTLLVSTLARRNVTVALSGDGGDELFAGYNRHQWGPKVHRLIQSVPGRLRKVLSRAILSRDPDSLNRLYERWVPKMGPLNMRMPADKAQKLARALQADNAEELYSELARRNADPSLLLNRSYLARETLPDLEAFSEVAPAFMYQDLVEYLPNDILCKVDRASMAESLEVRVPILDHRVIEFAWQLPHALKEREGKTKWILREVLSDLVPRKIMEQPKTGFGFPVGEWMRGPLLETMQDLLSSAALAKQGVFRPTQVQAIVDAHLEGSADHGTALWSLLAFQLWYQAGELA